MQQSIDWLKEAFDLAHDMTNAELAEGKQEEQGLDLLPDPHIGALAKYIGEYAPEDSPALVERVVHEVDSIVKEIRYDGSAIRGRGDQLVRRELRNTPKNHQMHRDRVLLARAYEYITAHY